MRLRYIARSRLADRAESACDLLWVLPSLTCGYSPKRRLFRVVREFRERPTDRPTNAVMSRGTDPCRDPGDAGRSASPDELTRFRLIVDTPSGSSFAGCPGSTLADTRGNAFHVVATGSGLTNLPRITTVLLDPARCIAPRPCGSRSGFSEAPGSRSRATASAPCERQAAGGQKSGVTEA